MENFHQISPGRWAYTPNGKRIATVIANDTILGALEQGCLDQLQNCAKLPGLTGLALNPDAHQGYGAPIGSVLASEEYLYPAGVGYDIKCSMSLLQTDIPADEIVDKRVRRELVGIIMQQIPSGVGQASSMLVKDTYAISGFHRTTALSLGIPEHWVERCEDASHGKPDALMERLEWHLHTNQTKGLPSKMQQLGTYGAGNHFGECSVIEIDPSAQATAVQWGLKDGCVAMLSHCGSRGFGWALANYHFKGMQQHFKKWHIPQLGNDRELTFIPLGTSEAQAYLCDIALAGNFATVNHMIINQKLAEAFQQVIPGCKADLVYYISHNFVRKEYDGHKTQYVHRKGATRAFPAKHPELKNTAFYETGHPILLPGNPVAGSRVMVGTGDPCAVSDTFFSINHGAGRTMGRSAAKRTFTQEEVDAQMDQNDILFNSRHYPIDESAFAYKDFEEVLASVELAGLATCVAKLGPARFVIKAED
jgi:tRNA-splicing ligase RtcB